MASAREVFTQAILTVVCVSLPASVKMTERDCKCCSDAMKAIEGLEERLHEKLELLNVEVSSAIKLSHQLKMRQMEVLGDIKELKASVNALHNRDQNIVSNLLQAIPGTSLSEVPKKIQEEESKIRRIEADVTEMKADRNSLREAVERVKRDLRGDMLQANESIAAVHAETKLLAEVLTPEMRHMMASLPKKLATIERLDKAGHRVMNLLSSSEKGGYIPERHQDHSLKSKKAANLPPQNTPKKASSDASTGSNTGEENDSDGWKGYSLHPLKVSNHSSKHFHNASIRDVEGVAAGNEFHAAGNISPIFLNDANLNRSAFDGIREIVFVGPEGNFSMIMSANDQGGCMEYGASNESASTTPWMLCDTLGKDLDQNGDDSDKEELPIEHVMKFMAQQLLNLQESLKDGEWDFRVSQLENISAGVNANLSELHLLVSNHIALDTNAIRETQLLVANMSVFISEALLKLQEGLMSELEGRAAENTRNTTSAWQILQDILGKLEEIEFDLNSSSVKEYSFRLINDSVATLRTQLLALNDSVKTTSAQDITELRSQIRNLSQSLEAPIADFDRRIQESSSLTSVLRDTVDNVTGRLEVLSDNANRRAIAEDFKLQARTDELKRMFTAEVEKLKERMENQTEFFNQLPRIQGWHPDDDADCPGLNVLAADESLVLSTEPGGRFRAPNLPSDLMPVGAIVHFHCVPAGTHRLVGERELRCLGGRRWSSPPPTCEALPTLEQMLADGSSEAVPSIEHDNLADDEWVAADDRGRMVVRPGTRLRLKCLYPRHKGVVSWLHNDTVRRSAGIKRTNQRPNDRDFHAHGMEIDSARPQHSGIYSCETQDGKRHSLIIRVADVTCDKPKSLLNGNVEVASSRPISVGEKVQFRCNMGYNLSGSDEITCLGSGRWSRQPPTCEEIDKFVPPEGACQRPLVPEGLIIKPDRKWYENGLRVSYSCEGGMVLVGMSSPTCYEGQWMGRAPSCM